MVEIDERVGGPKARANLVSSKDATGLFQEERQHLKRQALYGDARATLREDTGADIQFKNSEPNYWISGSGAHTSFSLMRRSLLDKQGESIGDVPGKVLQIDDLTDGERKG